VSAAIEHGLEATGPAPTKPPLRLTRAEPIDVLARAKVVAIKADWSLARWTEFTKTARACLTPDCLPEEMGKFMTVVRERFEVTTTPSFESSKWDVDVKAEDFDDD
jgi:hypothetical protein